MIWLSEETLDFPPVSLANDDGLLAIGGNLSPERLIKAYQNGIFPWFNEGDPILWWSPNPRMVLFPNQLRISKSMHKLLKNETFKVTYNQCFRQVITRCAIAKRKGQNQTWILPEMINAYCKLHQLGFAHSVEVWQENQLVGGLYGIKIGAVFCGESMFSLVSNASKYGFISFVKNNPNIQLIDCQVYSEHLESLGGKEISRNDFLNLIQKYK